MIAVIFSSQRTKVDDSGYQAAAAEMAALAAKQPGYIDMESARGADGFGITISYWANDDAARAWRDNPRHAEIRDQGRAIWYESYQLFVTDVVRNYGWQKYADG